jgi:hypothetical protein
MADAEDFLAEISSIVNTFEGSCPSCEVEEDRRTQKVTKPSSFRLIFLRLLSTLQAAVTMRMMQVDMPEFNNKLMCQVGGTETRGKTHVIDCSTTADPSSLPLPFFSC